MYKNFIAFAGGRDCLCKAMLIMKLTFIMLLVTFLNVSAASYAQKVTIKVKSATLKQIFEKVQEQTGYDFLYNSEELKLAKPITISATNLPIKSFLDLCFSEQRLTYRISNTTILVTPKQKVATPAPFVLNKPVTGKIVDAQGKPLPGVSVREKGTDNVSFTDTDGNFRLNLGSDNAILTVTSIGFISQEVQASNRATFAITLKESTENLTEIVVVGYGVQKRSDITGAVSSINEKTLREVPVTNAVQLLQGRVAGLFVSASDNKPGSTPSVRIRGNRSMVSGGNDPLYVIDGIPTTDGFNDINPNDIVAMEVLKDASATAIYGSRGSNGVILITTARGKKGKTTLRYDTYYGVTKINRYADIFTGPQYADFKREANRAINNYNDADPAASDAKIFEAIELESIANGRYTDWQRLLTKNGSTQSHQLAVSGATDDTQYSMTFGYYDDKGYFDVQNFKRYNTRINLDQTVGKIFKVGISLLGSYSTRNGGGIDPYYGSLIMNPLGPPYDAAGNFLSYPTSDATLYNPLSDFLPGNYINKETRLRVFGSAYAEAQIMDGLKLRVNFGPDLSNARTGNFRSTTIALPTASSAEAFVSAYTLENLLLYNKQFGKHKLDFTGLYSIQERKQENSGVNVKDLPVSSVTYYNFASANTISGVSSNYAKWDILSYMGRINYGFDSKYLLTLTGRADGSSRFAPGKKWGFFPSAALAYNLSNESFLKPFTALSNLKLRLSYGKTGNTGIIPYQTQGLLGSTTYDFDGVSAFGRYPNSIPNPELRWEKTESFNAGLDFGFFQGRITGSVEVYRARTKDLLLPKLLPNTTGYTSTITNVGSTQNNGVELTLSTQNFLSADKGFEWSTDFNMAYNKEQILELSLGKVDDIGNARFIGSPINVFYDYQKIGIWQTGQAAEATKYGSTVGQIKVADLNGNGFIDPGDRTIIGQASPKYTFGFNNRFSYKGLELSVFLVGVTGNTLISPYHALPNNTIALGGRYNGLDVDYWTPNNPTNAYPRPIANQGAQPGMVFGSTLKYFNASYLRIRNINLGYTLPAGIVSKIKAKNFRIFLDVTNPYILSSYVHKYGGIDPENPDSPSTMNYQLGLSVGF